jgi:hypothetical protein
LTCGAANSLSSCEPKISEHFSGNNTANIPHKQIEAKIEPIIGFRHGKSSMIIVGETNVRTTAIVNPKVEMATEKTSMNLSDLNEGMRIA